MGWSESGPEPRDAVSIAAELATLLAKAGERGPFVLVGHSIGGLFVRQTFAADPTVVAGMVLVEATHPDTFDRLPPQAAALPSDAQTRLAPYLAAVGVFRLLRFPPVDPDLPAPIQDEVRAFNASRRFVEGFMGELRAIPQSCDQVRRTPGLGSRPLAVLTAGNAYGEFEPEVAERARRAWGALQDDLARLSTNSAHRVVPGATHSQLVDRNATSRATVRAILQVVEAVRTGRPLGEG